MWARLDHVFGRGSRFACGVCEELRDRRTGRRCGEHLRSARRGHERSVHVPVLDRLAGLGLAGVALQVERPFLLGEPLLDRLGRGRNTGHSDRQVARLEPGTRPGEKDQHERRHYRDGEDRRRGRPVGGVCRTHRSPPVGMDHGISL